MNSSVERVPEALSRACRWQEWRHALAILTTDFPDEWEDICAVLGGLRVRRSWIAVGGGNRSEVSRAIDGGFYSRGWQEKGFKTQIVVDDRMIDSPTHKVDCFRNGIALEVEWNNKDPFYDRDLNNFRLLYDLRAVSVGVIVTRDDAWQTIFAELGRASSYGMSTTHWSKLTPRLEGGAGGGCPVLALGIKTDVYDPER